MNWYYAEGGKHQGPFDDASFKKLVGSGRVAPTTLVWNETITEWTALQQLPQSTWAAFAPAEPSAAAAAGVQPYEHEGPVPANEGSSQPSTSPASAKRCEASPFQFDGQGEDLLLVYLKSLVLTLLTLGVYRFWAKVAIYRWVYQHTLFHGARFDYHATGKEKFLAFLKALLLLSPVVVLLFILHRYLSLRGMVPEIAFVLCLYAFLLFIFLLRPLVLVGALRYNLARTSWSGVRFRFDGRPGECYALYLRDLLLMVVTLGFYWSWHHVNVRRFKAQHTLFGGERFEFRGSGLEYLGLMVGGGMLCYMSLGLFIPWYIAWLNRYHIDNLWFQGRAFKSRLEGLKVAQVILLGIVITIGTLGIGLPWAIRLYLNAFIHSIEYRGKLDLDALKSGFDAKASALLEGVGEAGDALESLGEFFGG